MELPADDGYGISMTSIDHFSRMVVLVLLHESNAQTVANYLLTAVISHNILLLAKINDRDPRF